MKILDLDKTYLISDTHFFHENIIRFCGRPFESVKEMHNTIIERWNATIPDDAWVIHAGDVQMKGDKIKVGNIIRRLKGRKILIKGNHDTWSNRTYYEMGFEQVIDFPIYIGHGTIISHQPLIDPGVFLNIHGHTHEKNVEDDTRYYNVSCEQNNYTPELLRDIFVKFDKKIVDYERKRIEFL